MIDAHSQIDRRVDPDTVLTLLEQGGVKRTIVSTTGGAREDILLKLARRVAGKIIENNPGNDEVPGIVFSVDLWPGPIHIDCQA